MDYNSEFKKRHLKNINAKYNSREDRNRFASQLLQQHQNILNIGGGGQRHLEKFLSDNHKVLETDITGNADIILNLDKVERLPFDNNSFDAVCAFDVLEHLENFHLMNEEIYRVAKNEVLISLPNSTAEIIKVIKNHKQQDKNERGVYSKYYGLPLKKPEDRHRWWFYFDDIIRYYVNFELTHKCQIKFITKKIKQKKRIKKIILGDRLYNNFYVGTVWISIKKSK